MFVVVARARGLWGGDEDGAETETSERNKARGRFRRRGPR